MNRQQRRSAQKIHSVEVKKAIKSNSVGPWVNVTPDFIQKRQEAGKDIHRTLFFVKNEVFSVQAYKQDSGAILAGVRRHDISTSVTWQDKQKIKNDLFGPETQALEVYPRESQLVDDANMYWLWILPCEDEIFKLCDLNKARM